MNAAIPVADMCSGTGELPAAPRRPRTTPPRLRRVDDGPPPAETLSRTTRIRLAGNAVVGRQAALMLTRGLEQLDATDRKELH